MANNRIFNVLYYIIREKKTTARELSEKFEVSVRTIHRDINTLCESGIPIYTESGRNGGIRIVDSFILESTLFNSLEQQDIVTALQGMNLSNNFDKEELLSKLKALFNLQVIDWIDFDMNTWSNDYLTKNTFKIIKKAIFRKEEILFSYMRESSWELRNLQPYKLIYKSYNWYLHGFCLTRKQFRLFKLSKMRDIKMLDRYFERDKNEPKIDFFIEDKIKVTLKFEKSIAFRVYDEFQHSKIIDRDNYLYVETELPNNYRIYNYILSFENLVEIIEPSEVRLKLKQKLNKILEIYKT